MTTEELFLSTAAAKLRQLEGRIEVCANKLNQDQLWARGSANENAVGNLMLHLAGNVRQWIVAGLGAAPDIRERDTEFDTTGGMAADALITHLRATVEAAAVVIEKLPHEQLLKIHHIQFGPVSGLAAIFHVVEHFGEHTGQIIFATKNLTGEDLGLVMPRKA
jgi:uncharacterized damage-inducible protein DinB